MVRSRHEIIYIISDGKKLCLIIKIRDFDNLCVFCEDHSLMLKITYKFRNVHKTSLLSQ
jgi:hypothetical protein